MNTHPSRPHCSWCIVILLLLTTVACRNPEPSPPATPMIQALASPPTEGTAAEPRLFADQQGLLLSWIEDGSRLRFATGDGSNWGPVRTILEHETMLANWADYPSVIRAADGRLAAHWLLMRPGEGFSYDAWFAVSEDDGVSWSEPALIHEDDTDTEHGFVSIVADDTGGFDLFWLDGREFANDGDGRMELRHRRWSDGRFGKESVVDEDVCTCCNTSAMRSGDNWLIAYRGHTAGEVRDIRLARWSGTDVIDNRPAHDDGWVIAACPVNGPALAGTDDETLVAWFTRADDVPRVRARFVGSGSETAVLTLSEGTPVGRTDTAFLADGSAAVSWLDRKDDTGVVRLAWFLPDERKEPNYVIDLGTTSAGRRSGFPHIAAYDSRLYAVWTVPDADESSTWLEVVSVEMTDDQASR